MIKERAATFQIIQNTEAFKFSALRYFQLLTSGYYVFQVVS